MALSWTLLIWLPMIAIYTMFNLWNSNGSELDNRLSMSLFSLSTLLAIIADGVLGWRWCQGKYVDGTVVEDFCKRLEGWFGERTGVVRRSARVPKHAEYDQPWRRTWQRLVWQERHRESIHLALLVACCAIGAILIIADSMGNYGLAFLVILLCAAIPAAMGVLAFESDDDHQQLRFLASRGVSPISLWLAKQVVWLPRAFWITSVVFFVSLIVAWIFNSDKHAPEMRVQSFFLYAVERWDLIVWYVLLGYGSGQLTSIVFRRAILAGGGGFALNLVVGYWVILRVDRSSPLVRRPHWWFLGFPVVSMFLFTLWQMNPRMFEVYSWRRYVQMVAAIGIVPLFLYIGILVNLTVDVFVFKSLGFR